MVAFGRERVGAIGGDCYIAPRARRRGLATLLHKASFASMRALGIDFMYGPPNPNNLGALLKAGSREVTWFRRHTRPLTGEGVAEALRHALPSLPAPARQLTERMVTGLANGAAGALGRFFRADVGAHRLVRVDDFDVRFTELATRIAPAYPIACVRDESYLRWRYLASPACAQTPYALVDGARLAGLVVLELGHATGVIVDVFVEPAAATIDAALELAVAEIAAAGGSRADVAITPGSPVAKRLARRGFFSREGVVFQVAVDDDALDGRRLRDAAAWHFTDGDKDSDTTFSIEPE